MIKRADVIKMIVEWLERLEDDEEAIECILLMLKNRVENMPDAVVRGKWIPQDETFTRFMCSYCEGKNYDGSGNFCTRCGAGMLDEWGEKFFLTKEEAEEALRKKVE